MVETKVDRIVKENRPFDRVRDLNPMDHVLIGSTAPDGFNFALLNQHLSSGQLDKDTLKIAGANPPITEEEALDLQQRRENQTELVGVFWFLDFDSQEEIGNRGYQIRLQPIGHIDHRSAIADPMYRVSAFNPSAEEGEKEAEDHQIGDLLRLSEFAEEHFDLGPTLKPGARFFYPKGLQKKHEY